MVAKLIRELGVMVSHNIGVSMVDLGGTEGYKQYQENNPHIYTESFFGIKARMFARVNMKPLPDLWEISSEPHISITSSARAGSTAAFIAESIAGARERYGGRYCPHKAATVTVQVRKENSFQSCLETIPVSSETMTRERCHTLWMAMLLWHFRPNILQLAFMPNTPRPSSRNKSNAGKGYNPWLGFVSEVLFNICIIYLHYIYMCYIYEYIAESNLQQNC